ncbi:MAG: hypothetical protein HQL40_19755 [Alphaproteobacteria bacterium]|nr:hypothetical protein [Alphaproteobacteria bacterium]
MERKDTDRGETGDKIGHPDPAAAPLETDAEATGTPTDPQAAAESVSRQRRIARRHPQPTHFGQHIQSRGGVPAGIGWLLAMAVLAAVLIGVAAGLVGLAGM